MNYELLNDIESLHVKITAITSQNNNDSIDDNNNHINNINDRYVHLDAIILQPFNNDFGLFLYQLLTYHDNYNRYKEQVVKIVSLLLTYNVDRYNVFNSTTHESIKEILRLIESHDNNKRYEVPMLFIEWIHKSLLLEFNDGNTKSPSDHTDSYKASSRELFIYLIIDYLVVTIASDNLSLSHEAYSLIEIIIDNNSKNNNNLNNYNAFNNSSTIAASNNHNSIIIHKLYKYSEKYRSTDMIIFMRYISLLCKIATIGQNEFYECLHDHVIDDVINLCVKDDILIQINAIDLLIIISDLQLGLEYLCKKGIIYWLIIISCGQINTNHNPSITAKVTSTTTTTTYSNDNSNINIGSHVFHGIATHNPTSGKPLDVIDPLVTSIGPLNHIDPLLKIESMRVLGSIFTKSVLCHVDLLLYIDELYIMHFLNTIQKHFDEGNEASRLLGTFLNFTHIYIVIHIYIS